MKVKDFLILVKEMRQAQKDYFKNRTQTRLWLAKVLEKKVDEVLNIEIKDEEHPDQLSLDLANHG
jgi:hypothetical protein